MSFLARVYYENPDAGTHDFAIPFPYLKTENIFVFWVPKGGQSIPLLTGWAFTSANVLHFTSRPTGLGQLCIRRFTYDDDLLERLSAPSTLSAAEINLMATQLLFLIQEALDSGLSLESEDLVQLLGALVVDLRWSYDVALIGANTFYNGERIGPVPITRAVMLPATAPGSLARTYNPPTVRDHVLSIRKNNVEIGTVTVGQGDTEGVWSVPVDVQFVVGDDISMVTTDDGGMTDMGANVRLRRTL